MFLSLFRFKSSRTSQVRPLLNWKKKFPEISKKCLANQDVLKKRCWCGWNLQMVLCGNVKLCSPSFLLCWLYWFTFTGRKVRRCQTKLEKNGKFAPLRLTFSRILKKRVLKIGIYLTRHLELLVLNRKTMIVNMPEKLSIRIVCYSQPEKISFLVAASLILELKEFCEFMRNQ